MMMDQNDYGEISSFSRENAIFSCRKGTVLLFEGSKKYLRNKSSIDIFIFKHTTVYRECPQILEMVAYNALLGIEAPRLYISYDSALFELGKTISRKEDFIRDSNTLNLLSETSLVDFLLKRIILTGSKSFLND